MNHARGWKMEQARRREEHAAGMAKWVLYVGMFAAGLFLIGWSFVR